MVIYSGVTLLHSKIPLAIYREIAAHLRQVGGVEVELIPQNATKFDYGDSQISGLRLVYRGELVEWQQKQLASIIGYYGTKYGEWKIDALDN